MAGLVPCAAGLAMLTLSGWSATAGYHQSWISLLGRHSFSGAQIAESDRQMWALWKLMQHVCGVNLAMSGATIATLGLWGLRDGRRWTWWLLGALMAWVGGNDVLALIRYRFEIGAGVPITILPLSLGAAGMLLARGGAGSGERP